MCVHRLLQCPPWEDWVLFCWFLSYIFVNGALCPQKGFWFEMYFIGLAICNVWDYVFMPGSGVYLLLVFKIKVLQICLTLCRGHKSIVAYGKK